MLASACLPLLFQAVEIEGQAYWDGGYSANPALQPLADDASSRDILVVQINPVHAPALPRTTAQILDRINELGFNASLLAQLDALARRPELRLHRIDADAAVTAWPASTRTSTDAAMLRQLRDLGRAAAQAWLARHAADIGRRSTLAPLPAAEPPAGPRRLAPSRPWLARLLRRRRD